MGADQADDFEKAILISFAQDGQVEESLKVIFLATIARTPYSGNFELRTRARGLLSAISTSWQ